MSKLQERAEALEHELGDPHDPERPASFDRAVWADEREEFPQAGFDALCAASYLDNLIPEPLGGSLVRFDELLALGRVVARRDLSLAIATGQCLLGALPVWLSGSAPQQRRLAEKLSLGMSGGLALTEEEHGSDLAGSAVAASRVGEGFRLRGRKWCINNATRGRYLSVLARTDPDGGARGFSIFLVDKDELDEASLQPLAKIRTHGIRGADISGMVFADADLPAGALVGRQGQGLDLVFKTMQISRTLCSAFSLGAADTALRFAMEFARERVLYGAPIRELSAVRAVLREAFVQLLLADILGHMGTRALSVMPEQMSVYSAVVKVVVPELCQTVVEQCAAIVGARAYLREGRYAAFQKLRRDAAVVGLFDGSSAVNRHILAGQVARLAAARAVESDTRASEQLSRARQVLCLGEPIPPFSWDSLKTSNRGRDDILGACAAALEQLRAGASTGELVELGVRLCAAQKALDAELNADPQVPERAPQATADRYAWLVTSAAALHYAAALGEADQGAFLPVALLALRHGLQRAVAPSPGPAASQELHAQVDRQLNELYDAGRMFSVRPFQLARDSGGSGGCR